jgi:hypothetical protein
MDDIAGDSGGEAAPADAPRRDRYKKPIQLLGAMTIFVFIISDGQDAMWRQWKPSYAGFAQHFAENFAAKGPIIIGATCGRWELLGLPVDSIPSSAFHLMRKSLKSTRDKATHRGYVVWRANSWLFSAELDDLTPKPAGPTPPPS